MHVPVTLPLTGLFEGNLPNPRFSAQAYLAMQIFSRRDMSSSSSSGGATALTDLTDVTIVGPGDGQVLTYVAADSKWKNVNSAAGFANPMTTAGDIIIGGVAGAAARLGIGSDAYVLTVVAGAPAWAAGGGGLTRGVVLQLADTGVF